MENPTEKGLVLSELLGGVVGNPHPSSFLVCRLYYLQTNKTIIIMYSILLRQHGKLLSRSDSVYCV